jgi:transposase
MLADLLEEEEMANSLPEAARAMFRLMLDLLAGLNGKIAALDKEIARRAREDEVSRRLMTVPGIGPISATAIAALAPPAETFAKGRDFAAWPVSRLFKDRQAISRSLGRHPKWANARSGAYSSLAAAPSCFRRANAAPRRVRGSNRRWLANRACW